MRVIAGDFKGIRLEAPAGTIARPTTDRVKEAIFSMVGWDFGDRVVDLFAGSGALGIEALSRGADEAIFVDSHGKSIQAIRQNLERCRVSLSRYELIRGDWSYAWDGIRNRNGNVGWIFVDPPYPLDLWDKVLDILGRDAERISGGVVCEHPAHHLMPETAGGLVAIKAKKYGDIGVTVYGPAGRAEVRS